VTSITKTWVQAFRANGSDTKLDGYLVKAPGFNMLKSSTEMATIGWQVIRVVVSKPGSIARETVVRTSEILRSATLPMMYAACVYLLAFAVIIVGQLTYQLGAPDRMTPGIYAGTLREISTWLTYMILVAISASQIAGDLGARKVREEIDALHVLGVDTITALIAPRVLAIMFAGVILSLLLVLVTITVVIIGASAVLHEPVWTQVEGVKSVMNPFDLGAALIKHALLGFFVGIVACQKGLSARGGPEGVGRVVAETVVVTFFGVWLFNTLFNTGYLTLFPDSLGIKG